MHKIKFLIPLLFIIINYSSLVYARPNFVIMGPPGAGKGSFAAFMKQKYGYIPICVGDRLKEHIRNETELGLQIKPIVERGDFVDTKIGINILREELRLCLNSNKNFIIDGFVRNYEYFQYLDTILKEFNCNDNVIFLVFSHNEEVSIKRILRRLICNECGEIYNMHTKKPIAHKICNECGNKLDMRIDDKDKEIIQKRFKRYVNETLPAVSKIESQYRVIRIDSTRHWADLEKLYQSLLTTEEYKKLELDNAMKTIDYYNNHAESFYDRTINLDTSEFYTKFLTYLPEKATILDAGCGVGRDTKYFLSKGYSVKAFDASEKMVEIASKETGMEIMNLTFQELNFKNMFDAVWAQASLLHIPYHMTREVYQKIHSSLKKNGIFYASYKYGDSHIQKSERDFYNMNESKILPYFEGLFDILEVYTKKDTRNNVEDMWLFFIVRKK